MSKQTAIDMYSHLYGKLVAMDDRFETKVIWSEELAIKNNGKWIPKEVTMSKQTALQWFLQELETKNGEYRGFNNLRITHGSLIEQALQMEREQIETAYQAGDGDAYNLEETKNWAEQYYNETYGGKDE